MSKLNSIIGIVLFSFFSSTIAGQSLSPVSYTSENENTGLAELEADLADEEESTESYRAQAIYMEMLGNGITYSFNYDIRFMESQKGPGARVGLSGFDVGNVEVYSFPVMVNYLLGNKNKYFEIGVGGTYYNANLRFLIRELPRNGVVGTMVFGYRYQPIDGMLFKASLTPVFGSVSGDFFFFPYYVGFSLGYSFSSEQAW
jgi:hypothetical protein